MHVQRQVVGVHCVQAVANQESAGMARCKVCLSEFFVKRDGIGAIRRHMQSSKHEGSVHAKNKNESIANFFVAKNSSQEKMITAAEVSFAYHEAVHYHSYLCTDRTIKLARKVFADSKLSSKIHCGHTKCRNIVENVLAPHSAEVLLSDIRGHKAFSIATDASNKGNIKCFPVLLRCFSKEHGVSKGLLDFYADHDETADGITNRLKSVLAKNSLCIEDVSAHSADNALVNYGRQYSVFENLKLSNFP